MRTCASRHGPGLVQIWMIGAAPPTLGPTRADPPPAPPEVLGVVVRAAGAAQYAGLPGAAEVVAHLDGRTARRALALAAGLLAVSVEEDQLRAWWRVAEVTQARPCPPGEAVLSRYRPRASHR